MGMYKLDNYSELPSIQGIYFITNIINQKYYLGRAVNIKGRYSWGDIEYSHHNYLLKDSILKYGRENFIVSVVEYPNITLEELINIEQGLLDIHYGNGLCVNLSPSATNYSASGENNPCHGKKWYNNGVRNRRFSPDEEIPKGYIKGEKEETCKKKSEAKKGENHPNYGKKPSEETLRKLSEAMKSINSKKRIRVITSICCYFSKKDAMKELDITPYIFHKLFVKDSSTGFYVEKKELIV